MLVVRLRFANSRYLFHVTSKPYVARLHRFLLARYTVLSKSFIVLSLCALRTLWSGSSRLVLAELAHAQHAGKFWNVRVALTSLQCFLEYVLTNSVVQYKMPKCVLLVSCQVVFCYVQARTYNL